MTWRCSVDKFVPLCSNIAEEYLMTTSVLEDVTCFACLDIVDKIAQQAGVGRPNKETPSEHLKQGT